MYDPSKVSYEKLLVGLSLPGVKIGYMDHTGCHQLAFCLSLPGVRLVT
jgi:hypothetical protein